MANAMDFQKAMDTAATDTSSRTLSRTETQRLRRRPGEAAHLVATFERGDAVVSQDKTGPVELALQATNVEGEIAPWLDDLWWTDALTRWGQDALTLRIAPTSGALLHSVILYQLHMLRRVVPHWRIVGHAYLDDVVTDDQVRQVALSPYHELRFIDQPRPGRTRRDAEKTNRPLQETLRLIRVEQQKLGVTLPVLARLASASTDVVATPPIEK